MAAENPVSEISTHLEHAFAARMDHFLGHEAESAKTIAYVLDLNHYIRRFVVIRNQNQETALCARVNSGLQNLWEFYVVQSNLDQDSISVALIRKTFADNAPSQIGRYFLTRANPATPWTVETLVTEPGRLMPALTPIGAYQKSKEDYATLLQNILTATHAGSIYSLRTQDYLKRFIQKYPGSETPQLFQSPLTSFYWMMPDFFNTQT